MMRTMFKNKIVNIMLIILVTLTLVGAITIVLYTQLFKEDTDGEPKAPTADEIVESSYQTEEITTNLLSNNIIRASFVIQLDNKKAKKEIEKRSFQVNDIIIQELSDRDSSDFKGSTGMVEIQDSIKARINEILLEGYVVEVYINQRVVH